MLTEKENYQTCQRTSWKPPKMIVMTMDQTEGKIRVRTFEGGNNPNNPCQPGSPNFNPNLNRCFRRGPS